MLILDDRRSILRSAPIYMNEHWELVQLAESGGSPLLGRIHDYFSDTHYSLDELPALLGEVRAIAARQDLSANLRACLTELDSLIVYARTHGRPVTVVAD